MIRHVVLLEWNEKVTDAAVQAVTDSLASLPDQIAEIRSYQFGPDRGLNDRNADYALIADFNSEADFSTYVSHPAHVDLMKNLTGPILASFRSAQFVLPE
ncbi:MAG: Dabb family protein [Deltaproteobacteria bacterium]|nr:Dabb family protein [Deltaproteobacteria bacterium]MBW2362252.1 Dabb family protein [Deltaproteobacteria bacterium]